MTNTNLKAYAALTKGWRKAYGSKPTAQQLAIVEALGVRPGSKVAFANAMYLRDEGCDGRTIEAICGGPQLNVMRRLENAKAFKVERLKLGTNNTNYVVTLTAKGRKAAGIDAPSASDKPEAPEAPEGPVDA